MKMVKKSLELKTKLQILQLTGKKTTWKIKVNLEFFLQWKSNRAWDYYN